MQGACASVKEALVRGMEYGWCAQGLALCWDPLAVAYLDLSSARSCPAAAQLWAAAEQLLADTRVRKSTHQLQGQLAALSGAGLQVLHAL